MDNMIKLIEYIMNKLEYKDKEAVLYVYNLYSVCRKEGASFNDFCNAVKKDKQEGPRKIEARKDKQEEPRELEARKVIAVGDSKLDDYEIDNKRLKLMNEVPLMMEKISDETEEYYYPIKAYIYTGISALLAIFILYLSFFTRIIYTSLGNRVDYSKMFALVLILFCSLGYIMKKSGQGI